MRTMAPKEEVVMSIHTQEDPQIMPVCNQNDSGDHCWHENDENGKPFSQLADGPYLVVRCCWCGTVWHKKKKIEHGFFRGPHP